MPKSKTATVIGAGLAAVAGAFVLASGDQVKNLISEWLSGCVAVVDIGDETETSKTGTTRTVSVPVRLHVQGRSDVPYELYFELRNQTDGLREISLARRSDDEGRLLSLAEASKQICVPERYDSEKGGEDYPCLMPIKSDDTARYIKMGRKLPWVDGALDYTFDVVVDRPVADAKAGDPLMVYAVLESRGLQLTKDTSLCRFERLSPWNGLIAVARIWRVAWAAAFLMVLAAIAGFIGLWAGEKKAEEK